MPFRPNALSAQCPMPHAPCPIPHAQCPINYILKSAIAPFVMAAMALSVALGK